MTRPFSRHLGLAERGKALGGAIEKAAGIDQHHIGIRIPGAMR